MMLNAPHPMPIPPDPPKERRASTSDKALEKGLRQKLIELASQPLTARSLFMLEQTARLARELYTVHQAPAALGTGPSPMAQLGWQVQPGFIGGGYGTGMTLAPSSPAETWGANAIRELVAKSGESSEKVEDPLRMVEALAMAKDKGLSPRVVRALEARLVEEEEPVVISAAHTNGVTP
jgi:hypothetical protein